MANKDRRSFLASAEDPAVLASKPVRLQVSRGVSVTIRRDSGSLGSSTFRLQASDLGLSVPEQPPGPNDWVDVPGANTLVTWTSNQAERLFASDLNATWLRVVYNPLGGPSSPLVTVAFTVRAISE